MYVGPEPETMTYEWSSNRTLTNSRHVGARRYGQLLAERLRLFSELAASSTVRTQPPRRAASIKAIALQSLNWQSGAAASRSGNTAVIF